MLDSLVRHLQALHTPLQRPALLHRETAFMRGPKRRESPGLWPSGPAARQPAVGSSPTLRPCRLRAPTAPPRCARSVPRPVAMDPGADQGPVAASPWASSTPMKSAQTDILGADDAFGDMASGVGRASRTALRWTQDDASRRLLASALQQATRLAPDPGHAVAIPSPGRRVRHGTESSASSPIDKSVSLGPSPFITPSRPKPAPTQRRRRRHGWPGAHRLDRSALRGLRQMS